MGDTTTATPRSQPVPVDESKDLTIYRVFLKANEPTLVNRYDPLALFFGIYDFSLCFDIFQPCTIGWYTLSERMDGFFNGTWTLQPGSYRREFDGLQGPIYVYFCSDVDMEIRMRHGFQRGETVTHLT